MIQHPAILSLLMTSAIVSAMMLFAGWKGLVILWDWDINSGSEHQLQLERSTYLISTILASVLFFHIISLFLYIFTADDIRTMFVGAMCAAGSLNANSFGYPVLLLKIGSCICAGIWLVINHADTQGYDYPLIKAKYALLLALVPFIIVETGLQFLYFSGLKAQVITSCCGSLFSAGAGTISSDLAALPRVPMMVTLVAAIAVTCFSGIWFRAKMSGGYLFAAASMVTFIIAVAALVSFISIYTYELPTHHCPFCMLHKEYGYIGYPIYAVLLLGAISGAGVGALMPGRKQPSLAQIVPGIQRTLAGVSVLAYLVFAIIAGYLVLFSGLQFTP
ncbi:hypothetical protein KI809_17470 [Geobacter pelophilus]|uniref:Uncharacterized protein n=1 Tax=Geoanaerobacter pelophilus TaxID=60036 RepID=A0AAW4L8C5_9BACT|nr:hypothetical protein [Geoanaerobacter pelophilus]MBT0666105.1 hypothetical protein [Geoanaerobacter pelophilus]